MRINPINLINIKPVRNSQNKKAESTYNYSLKELPSHYYKPMSFTGYRPQSVIDFWNSIKLDRGFYWEIFEGGEKFVENTNAINKLREGFDRIESKEFLKKGFVEHFCEETGFPNLEKVSENIEREILQKIEEYASTIHTKVLFAGYDKNCSVGKKMAFPGSDCDGMYFVFDDGNYSTPCARWDAVRNINQRLVSTKDNSLPELFKLSEIKYHIAYANKGFKDLKRELNAKDYEKFKENLNYDGTDFVKAAEFNIRLAKNIPFDKKNEVAMLGFLTEILRSGRVLANNFDDKTLNLIKRSPMYKYSNILRQDAFNNLSKMKIKARQEIQTGFNKMKDEDKYELIKNIVLASYSQPVSAKFEKYFKNNGYGNNINTELGNILEMYRKLRGEN